MFGYCSGTNAILLQIENIRCLNILISLDFVREREREKGAKNIRWAIGMRSRFIHFVVYILNTFHKSHSPFTSKPFDIEKNNNIIPENAEHPIYYRL